VSARNSSILHPLFTPFHPPLELRLVATSSGERKSREHGPRPSRLQKSVSAQPSSSKLENRTSEKDRYPPNQLTEKEARQPVRPGGTRASRLDPLTVRAR